MNTKYNRARHRLRAKLTLNEKHKKRVQVKNSWVTQAFR